MGVDLAWAGQIPYCKNVMMIEPNLMTPNRLRQQGGPAMASAETRTFDLPPEQADFIDHAVASGAYASANEVVRAGLQALQDRENTVERWLRDAVVPVALAIEADPTRAIPLDQVFAEIRALNAEWQAQPLGSDGGDQL